MRKQCDNCMMWDRLSPDDDGTRSIRGICKALHWCDDGGLRKPCGNPTLNTAGSQCPEFMAMDIEEEPQHG
jgi:hypothetical protein